MMSRRIGLGPVFVYEWITSGATMAVVCLAVAVRPAFAGVLLIVVWQNAGFPTYSPIRAMAGIGPIVFPGRDRHGNALVLVAAPAATAGAICLDRSRGTLTHMLMTDLSNAEIVLGKLAARVVPVACLLACTLPMLEIG